MKFTYIRKSNNNTVATLSVSTLFLTLAPATSAHAGMVSFFDVPDVRKTCADMGVLKGKGNRKYQPNSVWKDYKPAKGRLILTTLNPEEVGKSKGNPMQNGVAPQHTHEYTASVTFVSKPIVANPGSSRNLVKKGTYRVDGKTDSSHGDIPYIQYLICEQTEGEPVESSLPPESVAFFNNKECPNNWEPHEKLQDRFAVPIPIGAKGSDFNKQVGTWSHAPDLFGQVNHAHSLTINNGSARESEPLPAPGERFGFNRNHDFAGVNYIGGPSATYPAKDPTIPHTKLLACKKTGKQGENKRIPNYLSSFTATQDCSNKWEQTRSASGRFLVGLPEGYAKSGKAYGGEPLTSMEVRKHKHKITGTLGFPALKPSGIHNAYIFVGGSNTPGFTDSKAFNFHGITDERESTLPYTQMQFCTVKLRDESSKGGSGGIRQ